MFNWKRLCSDRQGYSALHSELDRCTGRPYYLDDVVLPHSCGDVRCTVVFRKSYDGITVSCEQAPVAYSGSDPVIARWLTDGTVSFRSYDELDSFLMSFAFEDEQAEQPRRGAAEPMPMPAEEPRRDPRSIYDRESVSIPSSDSASIVIDKEQLTLDLTGEIFGQDENIAKIVHIVRNHLAAKEKHRPVSIFLYGAPGTGKSAVAELLVKKINRQLDEDSRLFYRPVDCTQFQERTDISRLTGAAPGYVGFDEPGVFAVLEDHPNTVFVFEEIEKADKNVTEVIMQAMETGRQETNGKTLQSGKSYYDLSRCIIFFTSNIMTGTRKQVGFSACEALPAPKEVCGNIARALSLETRANKKKLLETGAFRREVISRMTAVIEFDRLTGDAIKDIAAKCISDAARVHRLSVIRIETELFTEFLSATCGETEEFGARELRREAENYFGDAFLEYSLSHKDYSEIIVGGSLDEVLILSP